MEQIGALKNESPNVNTLYRVSGGEVDLHVDLAVLSQRKYISDIMF